MKCGKLQNYIAVKISYRHTDEEHTFSGFSQVAFPSTVTAGVGSAGYAVAVATAEEDGERDDVMKELRSAVRRKTKTRQTIWCLYLFHGFRLLLQSTHTL